MDVEVGNQITTDMMAEIMSSAVKGMLLVAFIDDKLHWHEHQTLVESVRAMTPHASAEKLLHFLDESAHVLEDVPRSQWPGLFEGSRHLSTEAKVSILGMCTKLAFSDGHLTVEESKLIHQIAEWINIDRSGRKLWKKRVHDALEAAQEKGFKYTGIENLERTEKVYADPDARSRAIHESASRAYAAGEMEKCVNLLQTAATDGDAQCQALLGTLYQEGDAGLQQDLVRAVELFEQAASQTNLLGTFLLARSHYIGIGVTQDTQQGIRLFKRAALMNFAEAQATLGEIYGDRRIGGAWILVAASNGHTEARRYIEEQGDAPDDVKHLASRLIEAINALRLLVIMNPELALERLAEMENEDI